MVRYNFIAATAGLLSIAAAQSVGSTMDNYPQLTVQKCTMKGGCKTHQTQLVLDAGSHPLVSVATGESCYTSSGALNSTLCATAAECGKNCAYEGISNYEDHGVFSSGDTLTLRQYLGSGSDIEDVSPRVYLLDKSGKDYRNLKLLNAEFTFTVDVSNLPCGQNGALYFSQMDKSGGRGKNNKAGASYGTGYCDAQCYVDDFFNGQANTGGVGSCCMEMDIWEANSEATQLTPHPCTESGPFGCTGSDCALGGVCDKYGCGFNPYGLGAKDYYMPNSSATVDTSRPFTVVTQFWTSDNTTSGNLTEIRRLYVQDGNVIQNAMVSFAGMEVDSLTVPYCAISDSYYKGVGGMSQMGVALARGMTLIFSLWNDPGGYMNWLDSGNSGPCNSTQGNPALIVEDDPTTNVTWSNIKWGEIGSTYMTKK